MHDDIICHGRDWHTGTIREVSSDCDGCTNDAGDLSWIWITQRIDRQHDKVLVVQQDEVANVERSRIVDDGTNDIGRPSRIRISADANIEHVVGRDGEYVTRRSPYGRDVLELLDNAGVFGLTC